jgi:Coenzyme PQQ synthesis protein D (PqqD)
VSFGERFALALCGDEAVLVDLEGGAVYRLNGSAALACAALAGGGDRAAAAEALAAAYGRAREDARRDVDALLAGLAGAAAEPARRANPIRFEPDPGGGHRMCHGQAAVLWLAADGRRCRALAGGDEADCVPPAQRLLWAAPHLMALMGLPLLHAAAVERAGAALAFAGPSGAGKSALAEAFAAAGARPLSADLLVPVPGAAAPLVARAGETAIRAWAEARAPLLAAGAEVDAAPLAGAAVGPALPLGELWFVDAAERAGTALAATPVAGAEAVVLLLENSFAELARPAIWRDALDLARALAVAVDLRRAGVPDGLAALAAAAREHLAGSVRPG